MTHNSYSKYIQFTVGRELFPGTQTHYMNELEEVCIEIQTHYINKPEAVAGGLDHPSISSCRIGACDKVVK